ncbi:transmembrane protein 53-like [Phoenix dactylifera]|uniref:Transmembrane protein 53-like n=1 Tax=Phoenix dactylifera TaxID=42345 RepID=A0A8B7D0U2_PHODC|nr:transmembrane protein 53-like [Phoenix dactylifera]
MASLFGVLHRPFSTAAVVVLAAVSTDLPDRFSPSKPSEPNAASPPGTSAGSEPPAHHHRITFTNLSGLSFISKAQADVPVQKPSLHHVPDSLFGLHSIPAASPPVQLQTVYQYAKLAKPAKNDDSVLLFPSSPSEVLYRWHLPDPRAYGASGDDGCSAAKSQTVVVLLGWLGAKQKHLKRCAEWYTSRGFHAVTFTFPMADIMSYKVGGKAEQNLELLADHLADWVAEEGGKNLVFHTFSNTGWLTYGAVLEKFRKQEPSVMGKIKGCIVDSAPVAAPDPQVWASGFSAAFLKKQSVATKGMLVSNGSGSDMMVAADAGLKPKPSVMEVALLAALEKFFEVVLNLPAINRRLSDVLDVLSSEQPKCPQLYIYSSADRVIPAKSVESFVERQRRAGHEVRACDFVSSPHVDHFRSHPGLYTSQLTNFLEDCVPACCKDSS